MNIYQRFQRLQHIFLKQPSYIFGRFYFVRKTYSKLQSILEKVYSKDTIFIGDQYRQKSEIPFLKTCGNVVFSKDINECLCYFKINSFSTNFTLEESVRKKLINHANTSTLEASCVLSEGSLCFNLRDVKDGKIGDQSVATGTVINSSNIEEIRNVALDENLLTFASRYLNYRPLFVDTWLFWSFNNCLTPLERRRQNQTIDFHYDVHGFNFLYVCFYLTDVTKMTGAHALVTGSHKDKKLEHLIGSARLSNEKINEYYGDQRVIVIEGKSGTGFVEDASCYHRAIPPIEGKRLMLQLRYS
jgi:hypothetical protein